MKIKKSYIIGAAVVVLLAVIIVMGVTKPDPHAGHNHDDPHAGHNHTTAATQPDGPSGADLTPDKAYTLTDNKDGTYSVTVRGRNGNQIYSNKKLNVKPSFTEVSQNVLEIANRQGSNTSSHWAIYCDIETGRVSRIFSFVLAVNNDHVAYVDHMSGKFVLFVKDIFDESKYLKSYDLTDAVLVSTGSPKVEYTLDKTELTVTYSTDKGDKTITVDLFEQ